MIIAAFFGKNEARMMFIFTLLSWSFALFAAKIIRLTVLKGPKTPFVMELPPYRVPTIKGLLIHTWERTWQYIKKAGTIILGISIILWAMMTFPGLSKEEMQSYEDLRSQQRRSFLVLPEVRGLIEGEEALTAMDDLFDLYNRAVERDVEKAMLFEGKPLFPIVRMIFSKKEVPNRGEERERIHQKLASSYFSYREKLAGIDRREHQAALKGTIAGKAGQVLEGVTKPLGFDYRTNIALLGGFAAKEVIISTLGTAYSLGEVDAGQSSSISERLKKDPNWNPLVAFTLIIFIMLYVPCFITVISIKKESSWKWAGFSVAFNLIVAYLVSLVLYQIGSALRLG